MAEDFNWVWVIFIGIVSFALVLAYYTTPKECHLEGGKTIISIKLVSVGGGLLGGGCNAIYITDKGEASAPCGKSTGDVLDAEMTCK